MPMTIRRAEKCDMQVILRLLSQVLELHAKIRPDLFIPGTTKYTDEELAGIISSDETPVFVADDEGTVAGYAFCVIKQPPFTTTMKPAKTLYIDDLCVDENIRGKHIGTLLFDHVKEKAKELGCQYVTLNVWEGNDSARHFYDKMGMSVRETMMEVKL